MIEIIGYEFFQHALIAGFLASIACGIIGTYVVVKKISFISGGISHSAFGGIGLGYLLGFEPLLGAIVFSLGSALGIGIASRHGEEEDTVIATMWATGMAMGILFISRAPGYAPDLLSYLFGNILFVPTQDLVVMVVLNAVIIGVVYLLYNEFLAITFDEEFASIMNIPVDRVYLLLLCLIALTVVMLIRIVGVILVIALLTIPAAIARQHLTSIHRIMALAILLGIVFTFAGIWISALANVPSGAGIILIGASTYGISTGAIRLRRVQGGVSR
ncbi:MAG: metal ABC transporter permease [Methanomicrobiaceae archaeon]|nr:metal ABC transporter permease [Methanomicrobiaceae archaeon]